MSPAGRATPPSGPARIPPRCRERFAFEQILAAGGFAEVYLCTQKPFGRRVVLKLLHSERLEDPEQVRRFENEARITAALRHENIVEILDHDVEDGVPWIAYEFLKGPSLRQMLQEGPLPWPKALALAGQVARALDQAHRQGILHRDIKPENILQFQESHVKVVDFGLGKWSHDRAVKTRVGTILGTPEYMAPELARGEDASPQSDLYSLGILLYETVTGRVPFHDENVNVTLRFHLERIPAPPSTRMPDLPAPVDSVILHLLEKDPGSRPSGAGALIKTLESLLGEKDDSATKLSMNVPPRAGPAFGDGPMTTRPLDPRTIREARAAGSLWKRRLRAALAGGSIFALVLMYLGRGGHQPRPDPSPVHSSPPSARPLPVSFRSVPPSARDAYLVFRRNLDSRIPRYHKFIEMVTGDDQSMVRESQILIGELDLDMDALRSRVLTPLKPAPGGMDALSLDWLTLLCRGRATAFILWTERERLFGFQKGLLSKSDQLLLNVRMDVVRGATQGWPFGPEGLRYLGDYYSAMSAALIKSTRIREEAELGVLIFHFWDSHLCFRWRRPPPVGTRDAYLDSFNHFMDGIRPHVARDITEIFDAIWNFTWARSGLTSDQCHLLLEQMLSRVRALTRTLSRPEDQEPLMRLQAQIAEYIHTPGDRPRPASSPH